MSIVSRLARQVYGQGTEGVDDVWVRFFFLDGKRAPVPEGRWLSL